MINQIKRKDYPDFNEFIDDCVDTSYQEHRRGSNFYTKWIVKLDEETYPDLDKSLYGYWETNEFIWSEEDYDRNDIDELNRVELQEKTVVVKEWIKVKDTVIVD